MPIINETKEKETPNEPPKKDLMRKWLGFKPFGAKKLENAENPIAKTNSLQPPKKAEAPFAKNKKNISLIEKNNYLTQKETICNSNEFHALKKNSDQVNNANNNNKRATKSKSPFSRTEKHVIEKSSVPSHKKNNKSLMGAIPKKVEIVEKNEDKQHFAKIEEKTEKNQEKPKEKKNPKKEENEEIKLETLETTIREKQDKKEETKPEKEQKSELNLIKTSENKEEKKVAIVVKYDHPKYKSKRSKSSVNLEFIEEDIVNIMEESQNKNKVFMAALQNQGTLEIKGFNLDEEFISKQEDIANILEAKHEFEMRNCETREENSVFDKEMNKFLESTFQRQETPPFSKRDCQKSEENIQTNETENVHYKKQISKGGLLYDPVLKQYYDKELDEYFELI